MFAFFDSEIAKRQGVLYIYTNNLNEEMKATHVSAFINSTGLLLGVVNKFVRVEFLNALNRI